MEIYPNYTVFVQIANFLILLFLLNIIVYRPIRSILYRRKEEMSATEEITQNLGRKADKFSVELEENISETRKKGFKERENLKDEGMEEERKMLQDAYSLVEDKIGKAKEDIQDRIALMSQSLQSELKGFSQELAEKILGRGI